MSSRRTSTRSARISTWRVTTLAMAHRRFVPRPPIGSRLTATNRPSRPPTGRGKQNSMDSLLKRPREAKCYGYPAIRPRSQEQPGAARRSSQKQPEAARVVEGDDPGLPLRAHFTGEPSQQAARPDIRTSLAVNGGMGSELWISVTTLAMAHRRFVYATSSSKNDWLAGWPTGWLVG